MVFVVVEGHVFLFKQLVQGTVALAGVRLVVAVGVHCRHRVIAQNLWPQRHRIAMQHE